MQLPFLRRRRGTQRAVACLSRCQSLWRARQRLEKKPHVKLKPGSLWSSSGIRRNHLGHLCQAAVEKDSCRPYGPVCWSHISIHTHLLYSSCYFLDFFEIPLPCFSSPSAHLNRNISKLELALIRGPQIDCILQPGCGDLR